MLLRFAVGATVILPLGCSDLFLDAIFRYPDSDSNALPSELPETETESVSESRMESDFETDTDTDIETEIGTVPDTGIETDTQDSRVRERLGRGLVAVNREDGGVYLGWRLLASDDPSIAFNVYRDDVLANEVPIVKTTDFTDGDGVLSSVYFVRSVIDGQELEQSETVSVLPDSYQSLPLDGTLSVHRAGVGDLDGDGEYDYVLRRPFGAILPDNTHKPSSDTFKLEGVRRDGSLLWRIDLGWNIELGETFAPTIVFDLDGDGIAEVIQKTAEGTIDGIGATIGDVNGDQVTDYRDEDGRVLTGPEFLSIFDGRTGKEIARTEWISRETVRSWGDEYGNRVNHNFLNIAYLDGKRPSIVAARGIAELQKVWAYDYSDGALEVRWTWSSNDEGSGYINHGYHVNRVGDLDGDRKDEVIPGAYALDDDGEALWSTFEGHGDRMQLTDIDPARPGLEIWYCQEGSGYYQHPVGLRDAASGSLIFGPEENWGAVLRVMAADIDPTYPGMELWSTYGTLYAASGDLISYDIDTCNFAIYWDEDPLRELLDTNTLSGYDLFKWNREQQTSDKLRSFDGEFVGHADLFGDWREEIIFAVAGDLRIHTSTIPSKLRLVTLMQDPTYRLSVAEETMGSLESTQTGFFIGEGMPQPF